MTALVIAIIAAVLYAVAYAPQVIRRSKRAYRRQQTIEALDIAAGRAQPPTQAYRLADIAIPPHDEHVATVTAQHQACHRCRTGSIAFPCTCGTDCYAEHCTAAYTDRDAPRGDTQ